MPRTPRIQSPQWHDPMTDMLVEERRRRNDEFHNLYGRSRQDFWESVARRFICVIFYFVYSLKKYLNSTDPFVNSELIVILIRVLRDSNVVKSGEIY